MADERTGLPRGAGALVGGLAGRLAEARRWARDREAKRSGLTALGEACGAGQPIHSVGLSRFGACSVGVQRHWGCGWNPTERADAQSVQAPRPVRFPQPMRQNKVGSSGNAPSITNIRRLVSTPPGAEKPPVFLPAPKTRWHGTMIGNGLLPIACPTACAEPGAPS